MAETNNSKDLLVSEEENKNSEKKGAVSENPSSETQMEETKQVEDFSEVDEEGFLEEEFDQEELDRLYSESLKHIEEGEVVKGTVIQIQNDEALIDIGYTVYC